MKIYATLIVALLLGSCGSGSQQGASLAGKKSELETLKKLQQQTVARIAELEKQIAEADPSSMPERAKLVAVSPVQRKDFNHYINLQGKISTDAMYYVSPRGMGGQVKAVYVKPGDVVRKGQLLLKLDDALVRQNLRQVESQLAFARDLLRRQQNLWNEGIGTEVQLLGARNNVEGLEKQLAFVKEQASMAEVVAEAAGIAESVNIRVGEFFNGSPLTGITIIDPSRLKAVVDVPENYVPKSCQGHVCTHRGARPGEAVRLPHPAVERGHQRQLAQLPRRMPHAFGRGPQTKPAGGGAHPGPCLKACGGRPGADGASR